MTIPNMFILTDKKSNRIYFAVNKKGLFANYCDFIVKPVSFSKNL